MKEIVLYKTYEMPEALWDKIVNGFNECFPEHKKTKDVFIERYTTSPLGYCYHGLYYEDGIFAGFNSITPAKYIIEGKEVLLGLSGDTYVLPQFRKNMFIFMEIYNRQKAACADDGVVAFLGVPNPNSYQYSIKLLKCREISKVDFWILPVRMGNIIGKFKFLNLFSFIFSWISLGGNYVLSTLINTQEKSKKVHLKIDEHYLNTRLSASRYVNVKNDRYHFTYTITNDEGVKCAYIMFFGEPLNRSYRSLVRCVSHILRKERVDMVMFNGTLNLNQLLLIRTPARLEPRKLPFTVNITNKQFMKDYSFLFNPDSWDFTLLNLDVR